jgi:zona occludens toxin
MPITLITGAPGNGKSVRLLYLVEMRRQAENRQVFYSGIADLMLPWELFGKPSADPERPHMTDPSNWHELPAGSIVVIDECQRLFRPRGQGAHVPEYVAALETHRHKGMDIYLVTQGPMLIDKNVRDLVETHEHLMRKFGSKWATVHAWKGVKSNCIVSRKDSQESEFRYPKEVFTWFKSAEVHTVKFHIPTKVKIFLALPFILAVACWFAWRAVGSVTGKPVLPGADPAATSALQGSGVGLARPKPQQLSAQQYTQQFQPRLEGLFHTAPRYDAITKPTEAPVPVGCVLYGDEDDNRNEGSFCITQQGTRFYPPLAFIRDHARRGFFLDFNPGSHQASSSGASQSAPRTGDRPGPQSGG